MTAYDYDMLSLFRTLPRSCSFLKSRTMMSQDRGYRYCYLATSTWPCPWHWLWPWLWPDQWWLPICKFITTASAICHCDTPFVNFSTVHYVSEIWAWCTDSVSQSNNPIVIFSALVGKPTCVVEDVYWEMLAFPDTPGLLRSKLHALA